MTARADTGTDAEMARGRGALAAGEERHEAVTRLLERLWHNEEAVRLAAALALCGGNAQNAYAPEYGRFAPAFLILLGQECLELPTEWERRAAVGHALCMLLRQCREQLCGMGGMNYSFLGGALYLSLLITCRDTIEAIRRLRTREGQSELCELLFALSSRAVMRRLNRADRDALAACAGAALASLPPDVTPALWHGLRHRTHARRLALLPAVTTLSNPASVPYLVEALPGQTERIVLSLVDALARTEDASALPALVDVARSRNRVLRMRAKAAIAGIVRAEATGERSTLLRPAIRHGDASRLLRAARPEAPEPPELLLRPTVDAARSMP